MCQDDFAVDIGCSFGEGTKLIASRCNRVLGLDLVQDVIDSARERHCARFNDSLRFEQCDCLEQHSRMAELCSGCTKVFIDINGNRELKHVVRLLRLVQKLLKPRLVVVKSRELHSITVNGVPGTNWNGVCTADGVVRQMRSWEEALDKVEATSASSKDRHVCHQRPHITRALRRKLAKESTSLRRAARTTDR